MMFEKAFFAFSSTLGTWGVGGVLGYGGRFFSAPLKALGLFCWIAVFALLKYVSQSLFLSFPNPTSPPKLNKKSSDKCH